MMVSQMDKTDTNCAQQITRLDMEQSLIRDGKVSDQIR